MKTETLKKTKLPDKPGVYFFLKGKEILYIGKATSLKDRVKSYFGKDLIETRGPVLVDMVFKADKIDWQTTDSVLEALILEANLIKKYQPKHNTKEKSDKSFNYVCITREKLPKVVIVRGREIINMASSNFSSLRPSLDYKGGTLGKLKIERSHVFGPFPNSTQLREALKIVRKIFPFLDDKSKNYIEFYRQINLAPDLKDKKLYKQNIRNIILFFSGKKKQIFRNLKKEMEEYAKRHEFEKAGEIKRQMFALKHINDVALIKSNSAYYPLLVEEGVGGGDLKNHLALKGTPPQKGGEGSTFRIEAYDVAHMGGKNMVGVMVVVENGEVAKNEYRKFKIRTQNNSNDTGALSEMLERRLAHTEWRMPDLIVVDGSTAQINAVQKVLKDLEMDISIVAVVKDEHHKAKAIMGNEALVNKFKKDILLANSESHRFAINYHKNLRGKSFLK